MLANHTVHSGRKQKGDDASKFHQPLLTIGNFPSSRKWAPSFTNHARMRNDCRSIRQSRRTSQGQVQLSKLGARQNKYLQSQGLANTLVPFPEINFSGDHLGCVNIRMQPTVARFHQIQVLARAFSTARSSYKTDRHMSNRSMMFW